MSGFRKEPDLDGKGNPNDSSDGQGDANQDKYVQVTKSDWEQMQSRISAFEQQASNFNMNQQVAPPPPSGPTLDEQLADYNKKIEAIEEQIDNRIQDGKGVASLLRQRSQLESEALRMRIQQEDIQPVMNAGLTTMSQLSEKITKSDMPYYELVKGDLKKQLDGLTPQQRANPDVLKLAYNFAVGGNFDKIFNAEMEKRMREANAQQASLDASASSRAQKVVFNDVEVPDWNAVMSDGAKAALKEKGVSPDQYYQKLGYKGGWAEYYSVHKESYE